MARTVRVGIIGTGWVGASVAISVLHAGIAQELLLQDARTAIAEGEAMDLAHGAAFLPAASVRSATIDDMRDADAIVIAAGRGGRDGESRLALLRDNVIVARDLGRRLHGFPGVIVVVSNPVDILTHEVAAASGLPHARVIGTGTMLDTARLRQMVGAALQLDSRSIHAQVVGERSAEARMTLAAVRRALLLVALVSMGWAASALARDPLLPWEVRAYGLGMGGFVGSLVVCNLFYSNLYKELVLGTVAMHLGLLAWAFAQREALAEEEDGEPDA